VQELKVHHHVTLRSHQMTKLGEVPPLISYGSQNLGRASAQSSICQHGALKFMWIAHGPVLSSFKNLISALSDSRNPASHLPPCRTLTLCPFRSSAAQFKLPHHTSSRNQQSRTLEECRLLCSYLLNISLPRHLHNAPSET
jgi:hypothetical protein